MIHRGDDAVMEQIRALLLANPEFDDPHTGDAGRVAQIAALVGLKVIYADEAGHPPERIVVESSQSPHSAPDVDGGRPRGEADLPPDLQRLIEDALCGGGEEPFDVHLTHAYQARQVVAAVGPLLAAKDAEVERANAKAAKYCRLYQSEVDRVAELTGERDGLLRDLEEEVAAREGAEEWADRIAAAFVPANVLGEHSNFNAPWVNALAWAESGRPVAQAAPNHGVCSDAECGATWMPNTCPDSGAAAQAVAQEAGEPPAHADDCQGCEQIPGAIHRGADEAPRRPRAWQRGDSEPPPDVTLLRFSTPTAEGARYVKRTPEGGWWFVEAPSERPDREGWSWEHMWGADFRQSLTEVLKGSGEASPP